jgi:hypothetical protein
VFGNGITVFFCPCLRLSLSSVVSTELLSTDDWNLGLYLLYLILCNSQPLLLAHYLGDQPSRHFMDPPKLKLNCFVLKDPYGAQGIFQVDILPTDSVLDLKTAIHNAIKVDKRSILLFQRSLSLSNFDENVKKIKFTSAEALKPDSSISTPLAGFVHIFVRIPGHSG